MTIAHIYSSIATNPQDTFNTPQGLALGLDNEIAVADTNNHRCVIVDLKGNFGFIFKFIIFRESFASYWELWNRGRARLLSEKGKNYLKKINNKIKLKK